MCDESEEQQQQLQEEKKKLLISRMFDFADIKTLISKHLEKRMVFTTSWKGIILKNTFSQQQQEEEEEETEPHNVVVVVEEEEEESIPNAPMANSDAVIHNDDNHNNDNNLPFFKDVYSFQERLAHARRVISKKPSHIPCILERGGFAKDLKQISPNKFQVPKMMTILQFSDKLRHKLDIGESHSLFVFCNNVIPAPTSTMQELYEEFKEEDELLYITYESENTFGGGGSNTCDNFE